MDLLLHPCKKSDLSTYYQEAFSTAIELFVVTAYLTEWDASLRLNTACQHFRLIIGKDFGITRKHACRSVLKWLPAKRKNEFMVAELIAGFHPKAVFWKSNSEKHYAIVGSSNLTKAAFETNYEVNVFSEISERSYEQAKKWIKEIETFAVPVSEDWLRKYQEAVTAKGGSRKRQSKVTAPEPLVPLVLPQPTQMRKHINARRHQLMAYKENREGLISLFQRCKDKKINSGQFYEQLSNHWGYAIGNRLQGAGWEILGKHSDFQALTSSFLAILDAEEEDRDDAVKQQIDSLHDRNVPTRKSLLTEWLCLEFPLAYPVLNQPIQNFLKAKKFKAQRGASEGARYIDLASKLRLSLRQNPKHPAKNLAELDTVIWLQYGKKK